MKQSVVYTAQMNTEPGRVLKAYYELTKPGITYMVLASMAIGFVLGSTGGFDFMIFLHAALGTFLIAGGTAVIISIWSVNLTNSWSEQHEDRFHHSGLKIVMHWHFLFQ